MQEWLNILFSGMNEPLQITHVLIQLMNSLQIICIYF